MNQHQIGKKMTGDTTISVLVLVSSIATITLALFNQTIIATGCLGIELILIGWQIKKRSVA